MEQWIDEFLFRGRPPSGPGSDVPPTFHAVVGQQTPDPFGGDTPSRRLIGPLTPGEAEAMGLSLDALCDAVNGASIDHIDALQKQIAALEDEREQLHEALAQERAAAVAAADQVAARDRLLATRGAQIDALKEDAATVTAERNVLTEIVQGLRGEHDELVAENAVLAAQVEAHADLPVTPTPPAEPRAPSEPQPTVDITALSEAVATLPKDQADG